MRNSGGGSPSKAYTNSMRNKEAARVIPSEAPPPKERKIGLFRSLRTGGTGRLTVDQRWELYTLNPVTWVMFCQEKY